MESPYTIIPVNRLDRAKGRLASLLEPGERAELALATLATAWHAAREATGGAVILTADERIAALLGPEGFILPEDPRVMGLNAQLNGAIARLLGDGTLGQESRLLILHADLPLATAEAIRALIGAAPPAPSLTMVRSGDGGTNALLASPPGRLQLCYGPGSAAKHERAARTAGMAVAFCDIPELALDLDTPADILALLSHPGGAESLAGKALEGMGIRKRMAAGG